MNDREPTGLGNVVLMFIGVLLILLSLIWQFWTAGFVQDQGLVHILRHVVPSLSFMLCGVLLVANMLTRLSEPHALMRVILLLTGVLSSVSILLLYDQITVIFEPMVLIPAYLLMDSLVLVLFSLMLHIFARFRY